MVLTELQSSTAVGIPAYHRATPQRWLIQQTCLARQPQDDVGEREAQEEPEDLDRDEGPHAAVDVSHRYARRNRSL